jgi:hypothetical protein
MSMIPHLLGSQLRDGGEAVSLKASTAHYSLEKSLTLFLAWPFLLP